MELILPLIASIVAIAVAGVFASWVLKQDPGNPRMREISEAVRMGGNAFLKREYSYIFPIAVVLAVIIFLALPFAGEATGLAGKISGFSWGDSWKIAVDFLIGAGLSALAGYLGMAVTTRSASRAAEAAKKGMGPCLTVSFRAGAVMGMSVAGLALLGVAGSYLAFGATPEAVPLIVGLGFGASLISMFIRIGGGIYTKAADLGADLVGKVEAGIPEDDPRNPAVIADNVGDNVGDCAGMGADVFESYVVIAIAAMLIGFFAFRNTNLWNNSILFPLFLGAAGIFGSIVGSLCIHKGWKGDPMKALNLAFYVTVVVGTILTYIFAGWMFGFESLLTYTLLVCSILGFITVVMLEKTADYYTSYNYPPVRSISEASQTGPPTNFLTGLAVGLKSTFPSMIILVVAITISFILGYVSTPRGLEPNMVGIYATAITTMAMLSLSGIVMSIDSFGPVSDNANGIVEMANLGEVREVTDKLDAIGNTTKATTKGFAIGSAALSALALFQAFRVDALRGLEFLGKPISGFFLTDPLVIIGLIVGGFLPFFFSSYLILAVGKTGMQMVNEVRRQFREIKGIMEGTAKPDYARCVDIATRGALKEFSVAALLAVLTPIVLGVVFGVRAVGGLLIGAIVSGVFLAFWMANGGAALDNAKKYIELGNFGGKGSDAHKTAVMGDTVGDPLKDTAGPSINPLIKVLQTISIIFLPVFLATGFLSLII
ncbi:MAG: sodium-translocating pyrophosphatase [Candidatus Hecatellales archaeon]|nr:MAG: sodium-translocating pyrophosphatase [Candidatus Hecatellales archaeon]